MKKLFSSLLCTLVLGTACQTAKVEADVTLKVSADKEYQTMHSFGASDCWRGQYVGGWPDAKRNQMADWLFSQEMDEKGNPKGIGLSIWRFNIGSGSHEAGVKGGVETDWRRAECFLSEDGTWDSSKQANQRWLLEAAKERGVEFTLAFSNSAPYFMATNGMAHSSLDDPTANIKDNQYKNFADFMVRACDELGVDYLSPINEPQWDWKGNSQEGMAARNEDCTRLMIELDKSIKEQGSDLTVVFGESGDIRYLYREGTEKPLRDNQIKEMFREDGIHSIASLSSVAPIVTGHSYWSTWPLDTLVTTRTELKEAIKRDLPEGYTFWQSEYCPMEKNDDNPNGGGGRDLGIESALYIARIIHADLTVADATSWQSWTAFTQCDYKDGLIFINDTITPNGIKTWDEAMYETCKTDGEFSDSKYMWAMGNYSLFVRPGMVRVDLTNSIGDTIEECKSIMASAYKDPKTGEVVVVAINFSSENSVIDLDIKGSKKAKVYETSETHNLSYLGEEKLNSYTLPARSITTFVCSK
ncbi:MAG: glycoside hydrolase family 30 protein [Rikenellaceae bacterium]